MLALGLVGCGGSSGGPGGSRDADPSTETPTDEEPTTDELIDEGDTTNVSFLPLMTFELYNEWSGMDDGLFVFQQKDPFIKHFMITPVNATSLEPTDDVSISDFSLSEDGIPLNPKVNFPILQKVLGNQVSLDTAIVINTSSAMDGVDRTAFINEIKNYIDRAGGSNHSTIKQQRFTIWAYDGGREQGDGGIVLESNGFISNRDDIQSALDTVSTNWANGTYQVAGSNHTYDAIMEAIGRFIGTGPFGVAENLRDPIDNTQPYRDFNDLSESFSADGIRFTNMILFSSGYSDTNRFDGDTVIKALNAQSLSAYDTDGGPGGAASATKDLGKVLIYVTPEGESKDDVIEAMATANIGATYNNGQYTFADTLISEQIAALNTRVVKDHQYVLRFASSIRSGSNHVGELKTRTAEDKYGYTLSWKMNLDNVPDELLGMPEPEVEITGAGNEYLSSNQAHLSEINRFYPAIRWTNRQFASSEYEWISNVAFTANDDGSVTIQPLAGSGQLTLRNKTLDKQISINILP